MDARKPAPAAEHWIQTWSGRAYELVHPRASMVCIGDIAHALAHLCRFNGHCGPFYSVAEHCIRVANLLDGELALIGLLHDAPEAYLGDVVTPLKALLPGYRMLERASWRAISEAFDLPMQIPAPVRHADAVMLATEKRDLLGPPPRPWHLLPPAAARIDRVLDPQAAEAEFLHCFDLLTRRMNDAETVTIEDVEA